MQKCSSRDLNYAVGNAKAQHLCCYFALGFFFLRNFKLWIAVNFVPKSAEAFR